MKRNQELFEKIESYLDGSMSELELENFEFDLRNNNDLQREVDLHRFLEGELKKTDSWEFRKNLIKIGENLKIKERKKLIFWKIAVSIALVVGLSAYIWLHYSVDNNQLFDNYYKVYPVEDLVRGTMINKLDTTLLKYKNGEFIEAIPELNDHIKNEPHNSILKLYLGSCFLQTDQEKKAIGVLQGISIQNKEYETAQWYLALSFLKIGNIEETKIVLNEIVQLNGIHKKNAQSLLKELKR